MQGPIAVPGSVGGGASIGGVVTGATEGSVLFAGPSGAMAQDNANFCWNDTLNALGIGTSAAAALSATVKLALYPDVDTSVILGRARIDERTADVAHFSHYDQSSTTQYAISHSSAGLLRLNGSSSGIIFDIGAAAKWRLNGTGFQFEPFTDNAFDLGATAQRVRRVHIAEYWEGSEMTAPAAPGANKGRTFFQDNGAGKTQYCVIFPTGAIQVMATEP